MDVIITAGGIPKSSHPLYKYTQGKHKALLDISGKPMIQWMLDAISEAKSVGQVVVVGLAQSEVEGLDGSVELSCEKHLTLLPNQHDMVENIRAGVQSFLEMNSDAGFYPGRRIRKGDSWTNI